MGRLDRLPYHGRTHVPGGSDPIPGLEFGAPSSPFPNAVTALAATRTLMAYYRLGEASGDFADTSGYNVDGLGAADATLTASTTALTRDAAGAIPVADDDGAIQLNDTDSDGSDYLTIPLKSERLGLASTNFSVTAFVRPTASVALYAGVVGKMAGGSGPEGWGISVNALQPVWRREASGSSIVRLFGPTIPVSTWAFVVGTYSTTDGHKLYVDGVLVATDSSTFSSGSTSGVSATIGDLPTFGAAPPRRQFYGLIDEVSVWGATLTAAEVSTLYQAGGLTASLGDSVVSVSGNYTAGYDEIVLATGTATVTLPTAVGAIGRRIIVKRALGGTITVARTSSQLIDNAAADQSLGVAKQTMEFVSDGANWWIIGAYL